MAVAEATDRYIDALSSLLLAADEQATQRERVDVAERPLADYVADDRDGDPDGADALPEHAERYLTAAEELEAELGDDSVDAAHRLAALMGGHWVAATGLAVALGMADADVASPGPDSERESLASDSEPELAAPADAESPPGRAVLRQALELDVPQIALALRGHGEVRGGSADPIGDAVTHIVQGVVAACGSIASSASAGALLPDMAGAISSFVGKTPLGAISASLGVAMSRIRKALERILDAAVRVARKLIGDAPIDALRNWLHDDVVAVVTNAAGSIVGMLLQVSSLETASRTRWATFTPAEQQTRLGQLDSVAANYDDWAKWGTTGARFLKYFPVSVFGAAYAPVLGVAVLALVAYQVWVGADHLDWPPGWPLPHRAVGVWGVLEGE